MKIFYGVQGTGNGHITRARVMSKALSMQGFEVDYMFTGRSSDDYFDMDLFNGCQFRDGLTFNTEKGQVNYLKTVLQSKPITFIKDVKSLDLSSYDLVISDFEPVTAWAGKIQKKTVLGIGHQYAFNHKIPKRGSDPLAELVMKYFAPVTLGVGLHWYHFDQPILPPIIETKEPTVKIDERKILVYLPFESPADINSSLSQFTDYQFHVYSPVPFDSNNPNIIFQPLSRNNFQRDLRDCTGIISNAGFELASEALHLGKKILAKPLHAQMEQISNAAALEQLGYGHTMNDLDAEAIERWLNEARSVRINYPDVAQTITTWIKQGMPVMDESITQAAWKNVEVIKA